MSSPREWVFPVELLKKTLPILADYSKPHIVVVVGIRKDDTPEVIGSGTLLVIRGAYYVLTAHHVLAPAIEANQDCSPKYIQLAHSIGDSQYPVIVHPPFSWAVPPFDLALSRVAEADVKENGGTPLDISHLATDCVASKDDLYMVHGWPGDVSKVMFGGVACKSYPHGGYLVDSSWPDFDPDQHLALDYPPGCLMDETGRFATAPFPGGMSGSPLWRSNLQGNEGSWSPGMARVVGVIHRWDQESQCLIATRIEWVRTFLLHALTQEEAHSRWRQRGCPTGDDWADWFAAEAAIPGIEESLNIQKKG
jgi:hypothetical protein